MMKVYLDAFALIGNLKDTHLSNFFKRVSYRKGRQAAVSATARKLAVIIWTMVTKKVPYNPPEEYLFIDQKRKQIALLRKKITKFGINPNELGIFSKPEYEAKYCQNMGVVNQEVT